MQIPKGSSKVSKTPPSQEVTPPPSSSGDSQKQVMIKFFCDQLQKTIKDTEASAIQEKRQERAKIEES